MVEQGVTHAAASRLAQLEALLTWLALDGGERAHVLEIGSYEGESAVFWSQRIGRLFPRGGSVTCVDPWRPFFGGAILAAGEAYRRIDEDLRSGEAHRRFLRNITECQSTRAPILWVQGTLREALSDVRLHRMFDVVYIDGDHRYKAVQEDLAFGCLLVREGGLLCGDDLEVQIAEKDVEITRQRGEIDYYHGHHPGVSLAIYEAFGPNGVWNQCGVWAVRRRADGWSKEVGQ